MFRSSVLREHGISNRQGHRGSCGFTRRGRRGVDRNFRFGPLTRASYVSPALDEAHLDVSENKTRLPTATQVARTIREQILWLANNEDFHLARFRQLPIVRRIIYRR